MQHTMKVSSAILTAASLLLASAAAATAKEGAFPNNSVLRGGRRSGSRGDGRNGKDSWSDSSSFDDDMVTHGGCSDPVGAVLNLFDCVTNKDSVCAAAGYDPGFQRFHNENFTGDIPVSEPDYWAGAFTVVDLSFDTKFTNNPSPNRASVRYIETVTTTDGLSLGVPATFEYPFNVTILQHEHVLVDVDDDCNFVLWDQYGDDQEQTDVEVVVADLLSCVGGGRADPLERETAIDDLRSAQVVVSTIILLIRQKFITAVAASGGCGRSASAQERSSAVDAWTASQDDDTKKGR